MIRRSRHRHRLLRTAAVIMLGGWLALALTVDHGTGRDPTSVPRAPARPSAPGTTTPQVPHVDLAGLHWVDYHGIELPSSPTAGPRHIRGGLAYGFADTPLGAMLAALHIGVRANAQWPPAVFTPTIRNQVTGADAPALLASCQSEYEQARQAAHLPQGQPLGNAYVAEEAFRWIAYTPAGATVDLVSAGPGSQGGTVRAVTRVEVVWDAGDWRVIAPPGGDWGSSATRLSSLAGYTIFPGQG